MSSKITSASKILREDGPGSLAKETSSFFARESFLWNNLIYYMSLNRVRKRMNHEESLDDILDTVLDIKPGYQPYQISLMQLRDEIKALAKLVKQEQPKNILEIGTAQGGSFYIWNRYLDNANQIISLDLPGGKFGGGYNKQKVNLFKEFSNDKQLSFVRDDSHKKETYKKISEISGREKIDFLFIDGDHTYKGVKQDFEMYSELVRNDGIIALHDIVNHPNKKEKVESRRQSVDNIEERHLSWGQNSSDCNVDQFWEELVEEYDTKEIISHPKQTWAGIGVVRI